MAIDPEILMAGVNMADGTAPTGNRVSGLDDLIMANPQFNKPQYELPPVGLNLDNIGLENFDAQAYQAESDRMSPQAKQEISDGVNDLLSAAESGDEEAGYNALAAAALGEDEDRSLEEMTTDYQEFTKLVEQGPAAIEEFVRQALAPDPDDKMESVPEWALPMTVFGLTLQSEPGDWRQAILRARAKTKQTMFKHKQGQKAAKAQADANIKKTALDIYTKYQEGKQVKAKDLLGLVGKVTPESWKKYENSGRLSDLVAIPETKDVTELLKTFTASSVAKYQKSNDLNDLVYLPGATKNDKTLAWLKEFTPESVKKFREGNEEDLSVLEYKPTGDKSSGLSMSDMTKLLETYTAESVDKFNETKSATDLVKKEGLDGFTMPKVNTDSFLNEQQITQMSRPEFIEKQLAVLDTDGNPDMEYRKNMLRNYTMLYKQTIDTAREKISGETMVERLPFAEYTSLQYANLLGLDANDPQIEGIAFVPQVKLPKATGEQLNEYNALMSTKKDMQFMRKILERAPANVTGIRGEWFDSDAARILADISPFPIPEEATIAQIYNQAAQLRLVKAILNEERFSDIDRKLVNEFISGKSFASPFAKLEQLKKVDEVIERALVGVEFDLDGRRVPEGFYEGKTQDPAMDENQRREQLLQNIMDLSKK